MMRYRRKMQLGLQLLGSWTEVSAVVMTPAGLPVQVVRFIRPTGRVGVTYVIQVNLN